VQTTGTPVYCQFASVSTGTAIEREGVAALADLSELASRAQRVVLLIAASDVTLLRVKVPPMSASRLKAALPNLVEDHLMSDPAECVVVAGETVDALRTVAVVHRGWLEILSKTLFTLGARSVAAVPAQLCLPYQEGGVSAAITEYGAQDVEVTVRLAAQDGIGLPIFADQPELAPFEAIQALSAIVPQAPVSLYLPQARVGSYQDALAAVPGQEGRIQLFPDNWSRWIAGANKTSIDLMTGLGMSAGPSLNWRPWRWPLALAASLLVVNAAALNIDWLRMKREADAQHNAMLQTYKSAFPKETVIIDPIAQMRQKVAAAQRASGRVAPDDFVALAAAFSEAWAAAGQEAKGIAGLEYRDHSLSVKLKSGITMPQEQLKATLAARNLSLAEASTGVWQIRSVR
jgi:general secretion pathway protein L